MKNRARGSGSVVSIFQGYPVQLLQKWCLVTYQTAMHWKRGTRPPSRLAVKMFRLHSQGQIVTPLFDGWRFNEKTGEFVSSEGWSFSPGRIRAYEIMQRNGVFRHALGEAYVEDVIASSESKAG